MLQRSGWNEGEALGPDVVRKTVDLPHLGRKGKGRDDTFKSRVSDVKLRGRRDVIEMPKADIIDLTVSDSDSELYDTDVDHGTPMFEELVPPLNPPSVAIRDALSSTDGRTALLTPLPTVLKSDRLGIGLKAKTVGPYKASQKRVTHSAAAIAAHMKAAEEGRQRRKQHGRGRRGYDQLRKREETERKRLLAYLNG